MGAANARESGNARAQSVAGVFDYYLLALSWSPTFCLTHQKDAQCSGKGYGFVLHGLWPQYTRGGWPQACAPQVPLTAAEQNKGLTLFPTRKLMAHEWSKHGTCSGLGAMGYLEVADKALGAVKIPPQLQPFNSSYYFEADEIIRLFRQSNPGIAPDGMSGDLQRAATVGSAGVHGQGLGVRRVWQGRQDTMPRREIWVPPVR